MPIIREIAPIPIILLLTINRPYNHAVTSSAGARTEAEGRDG